jgi:hypothetical protein
MDKKLENKINSVNRDNSQQQLGGYFVSVGNSGKFDNKPLGVGGGNKVCITWSKFNL